MNKSEPKPFITLNGTIGTLLGILLSIFFITAKNPEKVMMIGLIICLSLLVLIFLINVFRYIQYVRNNRKKTDFYNNRPQGTKWWHYPIAWTLGFALWLLFVKNKPPKKENIPTTNPVNIN